MAQQAVIVVSEPVSGEAVEAWIAQHQPDRFEHVRRASAEHRDRHGCDVHPSGIGAIVDTIERDPEHVELSRARLGDEGYAERVLVHEATVADALEGLAAGYDLVFYDADPADLEVFRAHLPRLLAPRALLVSSNLFLGRLASDLPGLEIAAAYREAILADERLETTFLPGGAALSVRR